MNSIVDGQLAGKRVLVTGATGFIGGHLAQRLAIDEQALVTGTGRNLAAVPFLQRAGVTLVQADLLDRAAMAQVIAGQDVIFHVAAWLSTRTADESLARQINADATRMVIELAAAAGVPRVVLVSSIAAYGPPDRLIVGEEVAVNPAQPDLYGRTKALGELEGRVTAEALGVGLAIVRPGMVYGPRSGGWTVGILRTVQRGVPTLFGKADGNAFPIYIDNLCDLLILCAVRPQAAGEAFNAVDPPVSWEQFFGYYAQMAGKRLRRLPLPLARLIVLANQVLNLGLRITHDRLRYYQTKTVYPTDKAVRLLDYAPRIDIDEGMRRSEAWLRSSGTLI